MKLLVVLLAIAFGVWLWRRGSKVRQAPPAKKAASPQTESIVACAACGVHIPLSASLPGPNGQHYCCAAHRRQAGAG